MLRTAGLLALPKRALSAGFDGGISPSFRLVAAQLLGGWDLTETGLAPASHSRLLWTHECFRTPASSPPVPEGDWPKLDSHPPDPMILAPKADREWLKVYEHALSQQASKTS